MRRYLIAYALWFAFVAAAAVVAVNWYRHVEEIGWQELKSRLRFEPEETPPEETADAGIS